MRCAVAFAMVLLAFAPAAVARSPALPAKQLQKIKAATVFVKVAWGRLESTGSGFVVHAAADHGLFVTNHHVVAPPLDGLLGPPPAGVKARVEVVFNSGAGTGEWAVKAEVLYADKEADLALLRVKAIKPVPEPLSLTGADAVPETSPVYVCGFPFGGELAEDAKNPEISIGTASVSSNRTDAAGQVVAVQLNGALNPGNSGGPVVTPDGDLVGVAVRTVRGAGIGFAVPAAKVRAVLRDVHFAPPAATWPAGPPPTVRVQVGVVDALGRLKGVAAHVAPVGDAQGQRI